MKKYDFGFYLARFLTIYLPSKKGIKKNKQLSYQNTFPLLIVYCKEQESIQPDKVKLRHLHRELINRFLNWLKETCSCKLATHNQRLAAIHSFFRFLIIEYLEKIEQCQQILSIHMKKMEQPLIKYLSLEGTRSFWDNQTSRLRQTVVIVFHWLLFMISVAMYRSWLICGFVTSYLRIL